MSKIKVLVILGPTATGKSDLAVEMAKKYKGEIISADSRQVYFGMDIGSGKITEKEKQNIPHYLLDVASPRQVFSVARFKKLAEKKILEINKKNKLPIICGGTGFYIDTVLQDLNFPAVPANKILRKELTKKSAEALFTQLEKLDKDRADNIDKFNKVRLIRAIEIATALGKVPSKPKTAGVKYDVLYIGLDLPDSDLKKRMSIRLQRRMKSGMIQEVGKLKRQGVSYKRLESFGLEYKNCALWLQNKITPSTSLGTGKKQLVDNLEKEIWQYVKRQRTWFKRNKDIHWFNPTKKTNLRLIERQVKDFLK